jgi:hypothetical protein
MKRILNHALAISIIVCVCLVSCGDPSVDSVADAGISAKTITAFDFSDPAAIGVIGEASHAISLAVPFGTDVTALVPNIVHTGASISPASGTAQDFTAPVAYTVAANDGSTQEYRATVYVMAESTKAISSFSFSTPAAVGVINETNHTIAITVPNLTDLTALVPTIGHTGASVTPASGVARDFSDPVSYAVRAKNASVQTYLVTVSVIQPVAARTTAIIGNLELALCVAGTSARAAGEATGEIVSPVSERGICWNESGSPTVADSFVASGSGYGSFTGDMTGLSENTRYYVRAYVVNGNGTAYGNEISFNSGWAFSSTQRFGGYVFFNDGNGGGMVVADIADGTGVNRLPWYNTPFQTGVTAQGIGAGKSNTASLLAVLPAMGTAVKFCDAYSSGTFDDWYLPSLDEACLWFTNLISKGLGGFNQTMYWTSSELEGNSGAAYAYAAYFYPASYSHGVIDKDASSQVWVRPVRNF